MCSYIVKLLTLTFFASLVDGNGDYEAPPVQKCPSENYSCCIISSCPSVWTLLRAGQAPKVCGWLNQTPLVCCPHHIHQNPHFLDEEPYYVLQRPHYILRTPAMKEEIPQIFIEAPSTIKILPSIEDVPSEEYLPPRVRLPVLEYLPFSEKISHFAGKLPSSVRLPVVGYLPFSEKGQHFAANLLSYGKWLPIAGNSLSSGNKLSFTRNLNSNERMFPSSERRLSFTWNLPSSERRLPPIVDGTTSVGDSPCSEKRLTPMVEEKPLDEEAPAKDLPSSEIRSPPAEEEKSSADEDSPPKDVPSREITPPPVEETPSTDEEEPAKDLPSSEIRSPPAGDETPFNDEETPSGGDLPSSERTSPPTVEEVPFGERRRPTTRKPAAVLEMRPRPAARRKRLKISPPNRPSPRGCGRRKVDRSSDLPEDAPRTIDTDSPEFTTPFPEEEEEEEEEDGVVEATVVGGARANDKWAWMAGIFNRNATTPFCGGAVIDSQHILTAAHCFLRRGDDSLRLEPGQYMVKVGQIDLSENNPSYEIDEIKTHENYQPNAYYDDIAIIRLSERLPANAFPVCLPEEDNLIQGDDVTVLGWGRLTFGGRSSRALQQADGIPIVSNEECNRNYSTLMSNTFPNGIIDSMLCAGLEEGGIDACQGDSGGPLLREFRKERWALVGVVSFGRRCAEPGYPGIYTRVANYLSWVTDYIDESKRRNEPRTSGPLNSQ